MPRNVEISDLLSQYLATLDKQGEALGAHAPESTGQPHSTGSRMAENLSDLKEGVPNNNVEQATTPSNSASPSADKATNGLGGKDPNAGLTGEVDLDINPTTGNKEDPGTAHPAKNTSMGNVDETAKKADFTKASAAELVEAINGLLADITIMTREASGTVKQASGDKNYDELVKKAAMADQLIGFLTGQTMLDNGLVEQLATQMNKEAEAPAEELPEISAQDLGEVAEHLYKRADFQTSALVQEMVNYQRLVNQQQIAQQQHTKAAMDPTALMAMRGSPAEAAPMPVGGDAGAGAGGGDLPPEAIDQLVDALIAQGVTPEDLMSAVSNAEEGTPETTSQTTASDTGTTDDGDDDDKSKMDEESEDEVKSAALQERIVKLAAMLAPHMKAMGKSKKSKKKC
jgi:hypothetical protein